MFEGLVSWALTTPIGIGVTSGIAVATIVAVTARVSAGFRAVLKRLISVLRNVRLTTAPRASRTPIAPARWLLRPANGDSAWILFNTGAGVAHGVTVDSTDGKSQVLDEGFWKKIPGQHAVGTHLLLGEIGYDEESIFRVSWRDDRRVDWAINLEVYPRSRYRGTEKLPPIPNGSVVSFGKPQNAR